MRLRLSNLWRRAPPASPTHRAACARRDRCTFDFARRPAALRLPRLDQWWEQPLKAIKILLAIVVSVTALVVVAALLLVTLFDPNDYTGYVTSWGEDRTGRAFTIEGELELAFFPWLAVETESVVLGQPSGIESDEPFATVERIAAGVRLMPLL